MKHVFRAWDKKNKVMLSLGSLSAVGDFYLARHEEKGPDVNLYERFMIDYEWMQWSNINDKDNKNVFQGDIVEVWLPGMPHNLRAIQEITFIDGCFGCGDYPLKLVDKTTLKVIGNIYENPELKQT